jgi:hypothetical protein
VSVKLVPTAPVLFRMSTPAPRIGPPEWLIAIGGGVFILSLAISAVFVPDIRWLHLFQASMYVAAIVLSFRRSRWGYFIGVSAAGLWNYLGLFASTLFADLMEHPDRPDVLLQVIAWLANLLVIIGCVWAYARRSSPQRGDLVRFVATFVLTTAFLAAAIAIFSPHYLDIFPRMLHPHWPWLRR